MLTLSRWNKRKGIEGPVSQVFVYIITAITIGIVLLPLYITFTMSIKSNFEMLRPIWTLPRNPLWSNYAAGFGSITKNMLNSIIVSLSSTVLMVFISSGVAYVFVRHNFPLKEFFFTMIITLMVIPSVLSLTPQYLLYTSLGLKNSWFSLIIPYVVGGQVGAIFLFRTFMSQHPKELYEAARIDGANDWHIYLRLCLPLSVPILMLQGLNVFGALYNDYMWPMLMIEDDKKQMLIPVLKTLTQITVGAYKEDGISYALYMLSGIPLVFTTFFGLKFFINGEFASGLKL